MGNVKHTPGPWRLDPHASFTSYSGPGGVIHQGRLAMSVLAPPQPDRPLSRASGPLIRVGGLTDDPAEVGANARLVAAAPEMLEALKGLYETGAPEGLALTADELQLRFEAARAAISKATGGGQ